VNWIAADWPAPDGLVAGSTTRTGGVSAGGFDSLNLGAHVGDIEGNVAENRRRFAADCKLPSAPMWLSQVHGTEVTVSSEQGNSQEADAIFTREPDRVCAVMTADCLPVLMISGDGVELAAAHAGWRGLCNGVLESTLRAFETSPDNILAWLGPAISQQNFEVGDDVRQAFVFHDDAAGEFFMPNDRGRWQADLYGLARQRLNAAGVKQIYGGDACTYDDPDRFFSYRRDGRCGRMANFVFRYS